MCHCANTYGPDCICSDLSRSRSCGCMIYLLVSCLWWGGGLPWIHVDLWIFWLRLVSVFWVFWLVCRSHGSFGSDFLSLLDLTLTYLALVGLLLSRSLTCLGLSLIKLRLSHVLFSDVVVSGSEVCLWIVWVLTRLVVFWLVVLVSFFLTSGSFVFLVWTDISFISSDTDEQHFISNIIMDVCRAAGVIVWIMHHVGRLYIRLVPVPVTFQTFYLEEHDEENTAQFLLFGFN